MNYEPFFEKCQSLPPGDRKWVNGFQKTIDGMFEDEGFQDSKRVYALYYGQGTKLSRAQFQRQKKNIILFYGWLLDEGKVTQEFFDYVCSLEYETVISDDELNKYYFKSLDSALDFVDFVGRRYDVYGDDALLNIKAVVILSWYLVDSTEMIAIRKSDLDSGKKTVRITEGKNPRLVQIDERFFEVLDNFAKQEKYESIPGKRPQVYCTSQFLFRSSKQEKLELNNFDHSIRKFNNYAQKEGHMLSLVALKKNGIFCRLVHQGSDSQTINLQISQIAQCDKTVACGYAVVYKCWKTKFIDGDSA